MSESPRQEILLETGTNEMEIIEFYLGSQSFGINVAKLREIIPFDDAKVTTLPESYPSVIGTFLVRGNTIPLVDLNMHLRRNPDNDEQQEKVRRIVLVCEFNDRINGFLVDGVNQIHRVSWQKVFPMSHFIEGFKPRFTGSINVEGREVLIVDLEHIMAEIDPTMSMHYNKAEEEITEEVAESREALRHKRKVMLAEDSSIIRDGMKRALVNAGYSLMEVFPDGEECFNRIQVLRAQALEQKVSGTEVLDLLITDIEMPKLDGLTLCKKFKGDQVFQDVPVIIFSSLITDQMAMRCREVGASEYITKPNLQKLIELVDSYCLP